jgi:hypothetical protein
MALAAIFSLYVIIGLLSAAGSIYISQRVLPVRFEAVLFGLVLLPIAGVYLAFAAYFGEDAAFSLETAAVMAFALLGCLGTRAPVALIAGYTLHGAWDLLHEIHAHTGADVFGGSASTQIPLAYGAFCATYDWAMAVYFFNRRTQWKSAWAARRGAATRFGSGASRIFPFDRRFRLARE